jgi:formiminotetrahydrofolate cyclodeaminase
LDFSSFLEDVAARTPAPGGGAVAAVSAALAAALAEMAARYADDAAKSARAASLRERLLVLAEDDAEAYGAVLAAKGPERADALSRAAEVPLEIAHQAAAVAALAADLAAGGNPNLRGDAVTAVFLAEAAAYAAANLVAINLADVFGDGRIERANEFAAAATAAKRSLGAA